MKLYREGALHIGELQKAPAWKRLCKAPIGDGALQSLQGFHKTHIELGICEAPRRCMKSLQKRGASQNPIQAFF